MNDANNNKGLSDLRRSRPTSPRVTLVIPAKNEARNLEVILPQLPRVHEVILVDGNSADDTVETARRLMPQIRVLAQTRKGKGNALAVGFEAATGDIIVMFDADGSADPQEIPAFVDTLVRGADFAKGSRNLGNGGSEDITGIRAMGNTALVLMANLLFSTRYTDLCYGYNAFWSDVLHHLELPDTDAPNTASNGMLWGDGFEIETLLNCRVADANLSVVEVPSIELERVHGVSNLNARTDGIRVLRTLLAEKRRSWVRGRRRSNAQGSPRRGLLATAERGAPRVRVVDEFDARDHRLIDLTVKRESSSSDTIGFRDEEVAAEGS